MLSNAYFLAKFRFDTAENEPAKNLQNLPILPILLTLTPNLYEARSQHRNNIEPRAPRRPPSWRRARRPSPSRRHSPRCGPRGSHCRFAVAQLPNSGNLISNFQIKFSRYSQMSNSLLQNFSFLLPLFLPFFSFFFSFSFLCRISLHFLENLQHSDKI